MLTSRSVFVLLAPLVLSGCFLVRPANDPQQSGPTPSGDPGGSQGGDPGSDGGSQNASSGSPGSSGRSAPEGSGASNGGASGSSGASGPSAPPPEKIISVSVDLRNECSDKVEYCVDSGGSTLNTSLGGNTSTSSTLRPGTKIQLKKDNRCGTTVFTVPESKDRQKVVLCER